MFIRKIIKGSIFHCYVSLLDVGRCIYHPQISQLTPAICHLTTQKNRLKHLRVYCTHMVPWYVLSYTFSCFSWAQPPALCGEPVLLLPSCASCRRQQHPGHQARRGSARQWQSLHQLPFQEQGLHATQVEVAFTKSDKLGGSGGSATGTSFPLRPKHESVAFTSYSAPQMPSTSPVEKRTWRTGRVGPVAPASAS